ncbi:MAG: biotin/lipoyl-binding protein, partial [Gammaproteobacteria bacterium]|nr:biotin/lipoyl-binding protein [Gammaproteobacteria bacterium]MBU1553385.1 biotin/lipoyl-binding protein [Gammaproteobacteria bacterium]
MKKLPVLMLLATGAAIAWWQLKPNAAIAVSTTAVSRGTVAMLVANTRAGTVRACQRSKLSLTSGGTVAALHVQNGDRVTQGQLLMSMWDQDQQARLLQAEAQLDVATLSKAERCDASERAAR